MGKKKIVAAITAISLSMGVVGFATACGGENGGEHQHTFAESWSTSETEHWHDATCEHAGEVDADRAAHVDADGNKRCDECDYNMADAVAITVTAVTGGKVTPDKTSYKEGDTVTLTIKADTGYTFKSIKLGDTDKTAEVENGKLTFTATAATTVTAEFEANPITLNASVKDALGTDNAELGTVVFKNDGGYKYGDAVTLVVTPASDYFECTSLKITGNNKDFAVSIKDNGEVNLGAVNTENLTVTAVFTQMYKDISVAVKGRKLGVTETLAADTDVNVRGMAVDSVKTNADGKIELVKAHVGDTIYISAAGYLETAVSVTSDKTDYDATLEYDTFKELLGWGDFDFSKQNEAQPEITVTNNCAMIFTNDTYDSVTASMYVKSADTVAGKGNMGIMFRFVGDEFDEKGETVFVRVENNLKVQFACYADTNPDSGWVSIWGDPTKAAEGTGWQDCIFFRDSGNDKADAEAAKLLEQYNEGTLKLTAYRDGATVYVFLGDRIIGQRTFNAKYENAKCEVGFIVESLSNADGSDDNRGNKTWKVGVTETAPVMIASTDINVTGVDGDSVTANKQSYDFGEDIELTITPAAGQKLDAIIVNGVDKTFAVTDGTLTVKADRTTVTVDARFVEREDFELSLTVKGNMLGTTAALPAGTKIKLSGITEPFTVNADGKITGTIAKGKYTISDADGKYFDSEAVTLDGELTEITLEYDLFKVVRWDTDGHGLSHVNDANPYVEWLGNGTSFNVVTNEQLYDDVVVSAVIGSNRTSNNGEKLQGVILRFEDGKAAILSINMLGTPRLQFRPGLFDEKNNAQVGLRTAFVKENKEYYDVWVEYNITQAQIDAFNSEDGIELKLVRKGNMLYTFFGDVFMGREQLADGYADDKVGFGLFAYDAIKGQRYGFTVTETLPDLAATVTDTTADAATAHGSISFDKTSFTLGDSVTITISAATDYKLKSLTINGEDVFSHVNGTAYTFKITEKTVTVEAEFEEDFRGNIAAAISGKKFGVNGNTLKAGDKVTLAAAGMPTRDVELAAGENGALMLNETDISVGNWTLTVAGYKAVTITVEKDQTNSTAIVLDPEETFELQLGWGSTSSVIAADGSAQLTITNEVEYSLTKATYGDIAVTLHLNNNDAGDNENRTQGIAFRFSSDGKYAIVRREKNYIQFAHAQWAGDANGIVAGWDWQQLANLDDADTEAYNNGDLPLTVVRKGNIIYVFLNGKYIGGRRFDEKYINDTAKVGMMFTQTPNGVPKTRKIEICSADDAFEKYNFRKAFGEDKVNVFGEWTESDNKLSITGKGLVEFNAPEGTVKESVTMTISSAAAGEQGLIYTFADGRYVAIRWQASGDNGKIQFTMDTVLYANGSIPGWTDWELNADEKAAFESADGLGLTLVRNGKDFYVVLDYVKDGEPVQRVLYGINGNLNMDEKYAAMGGAMGIQIYDGKGGAFAYEHKTGDEVVVPTAPEAGDEA